jgi:uncharacterized protein with NRDE domain
MCTIIAIKGRNPGYPLIVGANRDEFYARPSTAPQLVHDIPRAVAGVDLVKGGSWMGANEHGVFVAVTNQRSSLGADPRLSSRGEIVLEALRRRSVSEVRAFLETLDAREYNPFNLIFGDATTLCVGYAREARRLELEELPDGIWVLPNDRIGSPEFPKSERALELVLPILDAPWDTLSAGLARSLGDHEKASLERIPEPPPGGSFSHELLRELQALCIHTPVYGTKSATLLALEPGRVAHYLFADGPPCTTPFVEVTELLR